jgi:hypothetical protein
MYGKTMTVKEKEKAVYLSNDEQIWEQHIKPLVTKKIIEEHKQNPIGKHSCSLQMVLNYLRRNHEEIIGKDVIIEAIPHKEWVLGQRVMNREKYIIFGDERYESLDAAEHGLFLKRLYKYGAL